jgi:glucose-1-phosphate thymidylyltransferase
MNKRTPSFHMQRVLDNTRPIVGLIPAAGLAKRLGLRDCSKELQAIQKGSQNNLPRVVSEYLLEQMVQAGCQRIFFIIRPGKWDIAEYFSNGAGFGCSIGYLMMGAPYGPPFTLSQAVPFIDGASVLTGFPDILIDPPDACEQVVQHLYNSKADVVLATFPCSPGDGCDLAEVDAERHVVKIVPKEYNPVWREDSRTWLIAAWRHTFTVFFADIVNKLKAEAVSMPAGSNPEWPLGIIMVKALEAGKNIEAVHFPQGRFLDIGTPERLAQSAKFMTQLNEH